MITEKALAEKPCAGSPQTAPSQYCGTTSRFDDIGTVLAMTRRESLFRNLTIRGIVFKMVCAVCMSTYMLSAATKPSVTIRFYDGDNEIEERSFYPYQTYEYSFFDYSAYQTYYQYLPSPQSELRRDEGDPKHKGYSDNGWCVKGTNRIVSNYETVDPGVTELEKSWVPITAGETMYGINLGVFCVGTESGYSGLKGIQCLSGNFGEADLFVVTNAYQIGSVPDETEYRTMTGIGADEITDRMAIWIPVSANAYKYTRFWKHTDPDADDWLESTESVDANWSCTFDVSIVITTDSYNQYSYVVAENVTLSRSMPSAIIRHVLPKEFFHIGDSYKITYEANRTRKAKAKRYPTDTISEMTYGKGGTQYHAKLAGTWLWTGDHGTGAAVSAELPDKDGNGGSLKISWKHPTPRIESLVETFTNMVTYSVWRTQGGTVGRGTGHITNMICIAKSIRETECEDPTFWRIGGDEPVYYRVFVDGGPFDGRYIDVPYRKPDLKEPEQPCDELLPRDLDGKFPYAPQACYDITTRNRYCLSFGLNEFDKTKWQEPLEGHKHNREEAFKFATRILDPDSVSNYDIADRLSDYCNESEYKSPNFLGCGRNATKQAVESAFSNLASHVKAGDEVFFFIATHGAPTRLALYDAEWTIDDMKNSVGQFKDVKFIGVIDACHSGGIIEGFKNDGNFTWTAWVAAAGRNELASCLNNATRWSFWGKVFLDWGWRDGYAKLKEVNSCKRGDGTIVIASQGGAVVRQTGATDSKFVDLRELATYADLLIPGGGDKISANGDVRQHVITVHDHLLHQTDVKRIDKVPENVVPESPNYFNVYSSPSTDYTTTLMVKRDETDNDVNASAMPCLFRYWKESNGNPDYHWRSGSCIIGFSLLTKLQWLFQLQKEDKLTSKSGMGFDVCSYAYLEEGENYKAEACLLGPSGWGAFCAAKNFSPMPFVDWYDKNACDNKITYKAYSSVLTWLQNNPGVLQKNAKRMAGTRESSATRGLLNADTTVTVDDKWIADVKFETWTRNNQLMARISLSAEKGDLDAGLVYAVPVEINEDGTMIANFGEVSATYSNAETSFAISGVLIATFDGPVCSVQWGGATFSGLGSIADLQGPLDVGTLPPEGDEPYPFPDAAQCVVVFDAMGGSVSEERRALYEFSRIGELPVPVSADGAKFLGWYTKAEGGAQISKDTIVIGDTTYYAYWERYDLGFYVPDGWTSPFFLTSDVNSVIPMTAFTAYDMMYGIYLRYAFKNVANGNPVWGFVNRFHLSNGSNFEDSWKEYILPSGQWGWSGAYCVPDQLQNLPAGTYTLTCKLDADNDIDEVDESNNEMSITFTVSSSWGGGGGYGFTNVITFDANGGTCSETNRVVEHGKAIGTLPTPVLNGYKFLGWFDDPEDEDAWKISATTKIYMDETYYAHWEFDGSAMVAVALAEGCEAMGKVTGGNATFKVGAKVSLKATANKGYVFSRWEKTGNGEQGTGNGSELLSQAASFTYIATGEPVSIVAVFAKASDDAESLKVEVADDVSTEADGSLSLDLGECVESLSQPKLTVAGLPSGLKYDAKTGIISGKATKPGVYTVKVTATNASATGKNAVVETFNITVPNFKWDEEAVGMALDDKYLLQAGVAPALSNEIAAVTANGWKLAVSGLPSGVKFDANKGVFTGIATKEGFFTVYFTATRGSGKTAEKQVATATFEVVFPTLSLKVAAYDDGSATNKATVAGGGKYPFGKKVTLKATAAKGNVFMGWYDGEGALVAQTASYSYVTTDEDVTLTAVFVTTQEDKASITANVDGWALEPWVSKTETHALKTNIWAGVYLEWPIATTALSETTVKVAGLPVGLKFAAKPVTSKVGTGKTAVTVTNVQANTIYGAPSAASKTTTDRRTGKVTVTPSEVKVTVTTAGKSLQTYQIDTVVDALPSWAFGTFNGGWEPKDAATSGGQVSLTVSAAGKVSGKALGDGLTYALAAPYYSGFALGENQSSNFLADVTASWSYKEGSKTIKTNEVVKLVVQDNGIGGVAAGVAAREDTRPPEWTAWQYNWKIDPWKVVGKKFDKQTRVYAILSDGTFSESETDLTSALGADVTARVTLKFAANGTVSVAGEFVTGYDEKKQKYTTVKATGSATLVPVDEGHGEVFIYLTPKGLAPHARCIEVPWPQE